MKAGFCSVLVSDHLLLRSQICLRPGNEDIFVTSCVNEFKLKYFVNVWENYGCALCLFSDHLPPPSQKSDMPRALGNQSIFVKIRHSCFLIFVVKKTGTFSSDQLTSIFPSKVSGSLIGKELDQIISSLILSPNQQLESSNYL